MREYPYQPQPNTYLPLISDSKRVNNSQNTNYKSQARKRHATSNKNYLEGGAQTIHNMHGGSLEYNKDQTY